MGNALLNKNYNRVWEIDFIRGFAVLLMVFDHLMFLISDIFGPAWKYADFNNIAVLENFYSFANNYTYGELRAAVEPYIANLFILICGLSSNLSKNNFKRGYLLLLFSFVLSLLSYYFVNDWFIHFGVISALSFSILIYEFINRLVNKNKKAVFIAGLVLMLSLVIGNYYITKNHIAAPNKYCGFLTEEWAAQLRFSSNGDFFPLFPSLAAFLLGSVLGALFYPNKKSLVPKLNCFLTKPVNLVGRHAIYYYIIPQAFFILLFCIISYTSVTGTWIFF